ncbi:MAG TPA: cytosine permease [Steroidobacteraceae bacterium]|nr:cytosine permease [Steroidobacteraceae bacterium]
MKMPLIEQRSIDYVPIRERHGKLWHLWPVWFTGGAHLATIATGFVGVALGGNLLWTAIAVVLGCAFGTFFMAFHATQGPQLGLPQMIQSRPQFGYLGALLVWGVALVTGVGYCAFNQVLAADSLTTLAGWNRALTMVSFGAIATLLAVLGYDLIHVAQRWLAYLLLAAFAALTLAAYRLQFPAETLDVKDFKLIPFLTQLFAAASYQVTWSISVSDYSRYLPRELSVSASFWWTYVGALVGGAWPMLIGTVAAALFPTLELSAALKSAADRILPQAGSSFLVVSLLGLVTITTILYYSASLTLLSVADSIRPLTPTRAQRVLTLALVFGASCAIALASSPHFAAQFGEFLAILLYLFTPWTAINLVDFYFVRNGRYSVREIFNPNGMYGRWGWRGLTAYFGGFVAMIPFFSTGIYRGPVARALGGADISMLVGLPVSAAIYLIACRSLDLAAEIRMIAIADRDLDSDAAASECAEPAARRG